MNRSTRRFLNLSLGFFALTCFVGAAHPRLVAWSETSNAHLIATTRAASCLVVGGSIIPNSIALDVSHRPLPPGKYICDWQGNTAQTTENGAMGFVRSGQPEQVSSILTQRGYKR
jgi:hypothetical protein